MSSSTRSSYRRKVLKHQIEKTEELSYLDLSTRESILKDTITEFGIQSQVTLVRDELLRNAQKCLVGIEDYYLRTTTQDYRIATKEYLILLTSYILVTRWMLNVKLSRNKPAIKNAVLFETCKFKY